MRKRTVNKRMIRRKRMDPQTARATISSARRKQEVSTAAHKLSFFYYSPDHTALTCVLDIACYLAFLLPVLGNDWVCESKKIPQGAALWAAGQHQRERLLPTFIPEEHLYRKVSVNRTDIRVELSLP